MKLAAVLLIVYLFRAISKRIESEKERNTKKSDRSHLTLFAYICTAQQKLQVGGFQLSIFLFIQSDRYMILSFNIYMLQCAPITVWHSFCIFLYMSLKKVCGFFCYFDSSFLVHYTFFCKKWACAQCRVAFKAERKCDTILRQSLARKSHWQR